MRSARRSLWVGVVFAVSSGCSGLVADLPQNEEVDGGVSPALDAGAVIDSGSPVDAGAPLDAGATDAGTTSRDAGVSPPPNLGACDGLADAGVFENITPPGTNVEGFAIAVDPVNQGTVYVGTIHGKFWKSTDCGAHWVATSGRNSTNVNSGMNWTVAVDPVDPKVVYTNAGYGAEGSGLYKSVNSGADWDLIWPPATQPQLLSALTYHFANVVAIDPADHLHVLLTFHEACLPPHPSTCIAETMNGGQSWRLIDGQPNWNGSEGQVIFFLGNSHTWLWGSQSNGFYRSADSGSTWAVIPGMTTSHLQGSQLLRVNGVWYQAGSDAIWRSPTGLPNEWTRLDGTGPILGGVVSDGVNIYASTCYFPDFCSAGSRYLRSPVTDGLTWTEMPSPHPSMGGTMAYDEGHHLLFSSNGRAGVWRVRTR
jgi:hypothetical protein